MADLNNYTATGRLTKDAEVRTVNEKSLLVLNVAVNSGYGEHQSTTFFKVQKWGNIGAGLLQYLLKGTMIGFSGPLKQNTYTAKNGKEYTDLVVDTHDVQLLGSKKEKSSDEKPEDDGLVF